MTYTDNGWDWDSIHVWTGEWWLLLIGVALLLTGVTVGYLWGSRDQRRREWVAPGPGA